MTWDFDVANRTGMSRNYVNPATNIDLTELSQSIASRAATYCPANVPTSVWLRVRDQALQLLVELNRLSSLQEYEAYRAIRLLTAYLAQLDGEGLDVCGEPIDVLFDAHRVESYVTGGRAPLASEHELRYYRKYGRELNPLGAWPPATPVRTRAQRHDPYDLDELSAIFGAIDALRDGKYRRTLLAVTNTVLGCGATPSELVVLEWSAFSRGTDGYLYAALPGGPGRSARRPARTLPVAEPYAVAVAELAATTYGPIIEPNSVNQLSNTFRSAADSMGDIPPLTITQLRTTWMVERARAGVPWPELATAAGVELDSLVRALRGHMLPVDPTVISRSLAAKAP